MIYKLVNIATIMILVCYYINALHLNMYNYKYMLISKLALIQLNS